MNSYTVDFFARCPVNRVRVLYHFRITTHETIMVEELIDFVETIKEGLHENIANILLDRFGGRQVMTAEHHGVKIETVRP